MSQQPPSEAGAHVQVPDTPGPEASRVNTLFGIGAVVLLVITAVVVVLLAIFVFSILRAR